MYAIVEIAGLQYKVEKDQQLFVNRLSGEEGDSVTFDRVLLTDNGSISVGAPVIAGASVEAQIIEHLKGDKVIVFKKKRRKGYKKKNGFRAALTKIQITGISGDTGKTEKKNNATQAKAAVAETKNTEE
ncbi:MAG: 50S ribosomal protein L21 [Flavobacteriaceae bacterium]|nr:50S ribosomal protein L21 [Flavobacteriaceae bacterium]